MKPLLLCHIRYNIGTRDLLNNSHENLKINCYPFFTILGIYRDFILIVKRAFELNAPPPIIFKSNNQIYDIEIIRTYISWVCEFNEWYGMISKYVKCYRYIEYCAIWISHWIMLRYIIVIRNDSHVKFDA